MSLLDLVLSMLVFLLQILKMLLMFSRDVLLLLSSLPLFLLESVKSGTGSLAVALDFTDCKVHNSAIPTVKKGKRSKHLVEMGDLHNCHG